MRAERPRMVIPDDELIEKRGEYRAWLTERGRHYNAKNLNIQDPDVEFVDLLTWWSRFADPRLFYSDIRFGIKAHFHGCALRFIERLVELGLGADEFYGGDMGNPTFEVTIATKVLLFDYRLPVGTLNDPENYIGRYREKNYRLRKGRQLIAIYIEPYCMDQRLTYRIRLGPRHETYTSALHDAVCKRVEAIAREVVESWEWKTLIPDTNQEIEVNLLE